MKKKSICTVALLAGIALGAAPVGESPIDQTKNVLHNGKYITQAFAKLSAMREDSTKKFVVFHFGDSHIQADNFSGIIRRNFHAAFGDGGEGILFPYSLCKSFGPKSLTSSSTGTWTWLTVLKNQQTENVGVTGYTLKTQDSTATLTFRYNPESPTYNPTEVSFWYGGGNSIVLLKNPAPGVTMESDENVQGNDCRRMIIHGYRPGTDITFRLKRSSPKGKFDFSFYGISFGSNQGLQYNRCGVVGATFLQLTAQQDFAMEQMRWMKPDLVIFSYGSNESYNAALNMDTYTTQVARFISSLKSKFPEAHILITTPPDTRSGGRFPVNTQAIVDSLRMICDEQQCAFWDLHAVMGGNNSIPYWLDNGLARKDKLHFTKSGYELQGNLFSDAFMNEYLGQYTNEILPQSDTIKAAIATQLSKLKPAVRNVVVVSAKETTHEVKQGETLSSIARANNVTVDQLCEWNGIRKTDVLKIGQKLVIKG